MPRKTQTPSALDTVARDAQRTLLLASLRAAEWNLTRTAEALDLRGPQEVRRAIVRLGLESEYAAARDAGLIAPGGRSKA